MISHLVILAHLSDSHLQSTTHDRYTQFTHDVPDVEKGPKDTKEILSYN
jgi:hypothetical protein